MSTNERRPVLGRARDLPVLVKILSAVVVTVVVAVAVGVLGLVKLGGTAGQVQAMYAAQVKPLGVLAQAQRTEMQLRLDVSLHDTATNAAAMDKVEATIKEHDAQ